MPRRTKKAPPPAPPPPDEVDLNQVVAYNVRAARELRGWTQDQLALQLEPYLGQRITQAAVSSIERAWDGERRREFDAHELLVFAMVFDLPIIWFLLPPPGDRRQMTGTTRQVNELYKWLMGSPEMLPPLYDRLHEYGIVDPTAADEAAEKVTGIPGPGRRWGYKERRKEMLLALVDQHADSLDNAVDELGRWVDHLRQVGIRGFLAEHTNDNDFAKPPGKRSADKTAPAGTQDPPATAGTQDQPATAGTQDQPARATSGADAPRKQARNKR